MTGPMEFGGALARMPLLKRLVPSIKRRYRSAVGRRYFIANALNRRFLLDARNLVDRQIDAFGAFEREQVKRFLREAERRRPRVFLDIGACWGYYSLLMCDLPGVEDVYAFEPDPINRSQLYGNIFINEAHSRIQVREYGASDARRKLAFEHGGPRNRGGGRIAEGDGTATIEVRALDDELAMAGQVIFIKMDVEGHELYAVAGMRHLLERNDCFCQIESTERNRGQLIALMGERGYHHVGSIGDDHYFERA